MSRSVIYFSALGAIVIASIVLRAMSPGLPSIKLSATQPANEGGPLDYVAHPWVAPGEEDKGPRRIISLAPNITETICALGLKDRLVGRTQYCEYPPEVKKVPVVGALQDPSYEKIKDLHPDVVFVTWNSFELISRLAAMGIKTQQVPHETLEEVYTGIDLIGKLCDRPHTAHALIGAIVADVERLSHEARQHPHPDTRVLMVLELRVPPEPPFVAGAGTFLDSILQRAGYTNAARGVLKSARYDDLGLEKLVEVNPDVILDFGAVRTREQDAELYSSWSGIPGLKAIRDQRVVQIGGKQWLSASPRIAIELYRFITLLGQSGSSRPAATAVP